MNKVILKSPPPTNSSISQALRRPAFISKDFKIKLFCSGMNRNAEPTGPLRRIIVKWTLSFSM